MDTLKVEVVNVSEMGGSTLLGISIEPLISAFVAIFVFVLGLYISHKNQIIKQYKHLKTIEKYLYTLFQDVEKGIDAKIASFKNLLSQLETKKQQDFEMEYVSDPSMEYMDEIDWIDYFKIFSTLKTGDSAENVGIFQTMNRIVADIKAVNYLWIDSYRELMNRQLEYERRWNTRVRDIGKVTDDFVSWARRVNYSRGTDSFIDELDKTLSEHQKQLPDSADLYVAMSSLIRPLRTLIRGNPENLWGRKFLDPVMDCMSAYDNYVKNREVFQRQFGKYVERLESMKGELDASVKKMKKLKDDKPRMLQFWKF